MSISVAVPSKAKPRISSRDNIPQEIQTYDSDNVYPQKVLNILSASGTGSACADLCKKHLRGRGFLNKDVENFVVNAKDETLGDIHSLICSDRSVIKGFALHVSYNALFEIVGLSHIPIEMVRIGITDDNGRVTKLAVHPDWAMQRQSKKFKKSDIVYLDVFTVDPVRIQKQIDEAGGFEKWRGQIYYFSETGYLQYPYAICDSVLEDVQTDSGIKIWKNRGVNTGFAASHILFYKGTFESDEERQTFIKDVNEYHGPDRSYRVMVVECPTEESKPDLEKIEAINADGIWEKTEETTRENIIRKYQQPLALHAIKTPGQLGLSKEWEEAKINYDERTEEERDRIWKVLAEIMQAWTNEGGLPKGNLEYFKVIPITGDRPKNVRKTLSEFLTADAIKECRAIVESNILSREQKINMLVETYPMAIETAQKLVGDGSQPN